jgi:hypothetical protein
MQARREESGALQLSELICHRPAHATGRSRPSRRRDRSWFLGADFREIEAIIAEALRNLAFIAM